MIVEKFSWIVGKETVDGERVVSLFIKKTRIIAVTVKGVDSRYLRRAFEEIADKIKL